MMCHSHSAEPKARNFLDMLAELKIFIMWNLEKHGVEVVCHVIAFYFKKNGGVYLRGT